MQNKDKKRIRLKKKIRVKIQGTALRPRLSVFRSNKFIYAQLIDDTTGMVLAQASDLPRKAGTKTAPKGSKKTKTDRAREVGKLIGEAGKKAKIETVIFDRNGFKYSGRIKLLADEARATGLKF